MGLRNRFERAECVNRFDRVDRIDAICSKDTVKAGRKLFDGVIKINVPWNVTDWHGA
jgi:hypothetical protein